MPLKQLFTRTVTPFQLLLSYYFFAITISYLLLRIPGVHKEGVEVSHLDSLFTGC